MSQSRDNVKAGLFVIVGSLLALVIVFVLADLEKMLEDYQQVQVVYKVSDGVKGLDEGADVTLGDQSIGTVVAIEDVLDNDGRATGIRVVMEIPQRYQLYNNAAVELVVPPLGSGTRLNIRSVGDETPYAAGTDLPGRMAGSELTRNLMSEAGIKDLQRQQIAQIVENLADLTQALVGDDKGGDLRATVANMRQLTDMLADEAHREKLAAILTNVRDLTASLNGELDDGDIRTALANLKDTTQWMKDSLHGKQGEQLQTMVADLAATSESLRVAAEALRGEDGEEIRQTMQNLRDLSVALTGEDKAMDVRVTLQNLRDVTQAVAGDNKGEEIRQAMVSLRNAAGFIESQLPVIERSLANVLIMTGQLKLAAIEIRRTPWRLMYKPKEQELETENLYDAARSFALAASTLDAASQNLKSAAGTNRVDAQRLKDMIAKLETVMSKVESAEGEFWNAMQENTAPPSPGQ